MTVNTVAVVTLPASALRLPTPADRPTVRVLTACPTPRPWTWGVTQTPAYVSKGISICE